MKLSELKVNSSNGRKCVEMVFSGLRWSGKSDNVLKTIVREKLIGEWRHKTPAVNSFFILFQLILITVFLLLPTIVYVGYHRPVRIPTVRISPGILAEVSQTRSSASSLPPGTRQCCRSICGSLKFEICSVPLVLFLFSLAFTCLQLFFTVQTIGIPYGWTAVLLGPGRWGPIVLSWLLAYRCRTGLSAQPVTDNHR